MPTDVNAESVPEPLDPTIAVACPSCNASVDVGLGPARLVKKASRNAHIVCGECGCGAHLYVTETHGLAADEFMLRMEGRWRVWAWAPDEFASNVHADNAFPAPPWIIIAP